MKKYKIVKKKNGKFSLKQKTWFWWETTLGSSSEFEDYRECETFLKILYPNDKYELQYDTREW